MRRILVVAGGLLVLGTACLEEPCDRYVDYMCDCHDGEEGFDCAELQRVYADADPDIQDQCQIELNAQQRDDEDEGHWCATGDTGV